MLFTLYSEALLVSVICFILHSFPWSPDRDQIFVATPLAGSMYTFNCPIPDPYMWYQKDMQRPLVDGKVRLSNLAFLFWSMPLVSA